MKTRITIFSIIALAASTFAGELNQWNSGVARLFGGVTRATNSLIASTNLPTATTLTDTEDVSYALNHTYQFFFAAKGSNYANVIGSRSADGTNYIPFVTNALAAASATGQTNSAEITFSGKWKTVRISSSLVLTNGSYQVNYIGQ